MMTYVKSLVLLGICGGLLGCAGVPDPTWPPPIYPCPTSADVIRLAALLPLPVDPLDAIEIDALASRFVGAAAYCAVAAEYLQ